MIERIIGYTGLVSINFLKEIPVNDSPVDIHTRNPKHLSWGESCTWLFLHLQRVARRYFTHPGLDEALTSSYFPLIYLCYCTQINKHAIWKCACYKMLVSGNFPGFPPKHKFLQSPYVKILKLPSTQAFGIIQT